MSPPTDRFLNLSVTDTMPPRENPPDSEGEEEEEEPIEEEAGSDDDETGIRTFRDQTPMVSGYSGFNYSLQGLDKEAKDRALSALGSTFDVVSCSSTAQGYVFHLAQHHRLHLSRSETRPRNAPSCTCVWSALHPEMACHHMFWLLDRLHGCLHPQPDPNSTIRVSSNGYPSDISRVKSLLDGQLDIIADQLNWPYERSAAEGGMRRSLRARDLLTAFSATQLPEDFRPDLADDAAHSRTPEQCVVQGDFEATMLRLAVHDDAVYARLCKAMPPAACAAIYFDKMQERSRKLLAEFDRYCMTGRASDDPSRENRDWDVRTVISTLQDNVDRIERNITLRAPHGSESAARALVTLLEDIAQRDKDALEGNAWGKSSFHGEDEDHRNLYHQLVGRAEETGRFFGLEALAQLAGADLYPFSGRLGAVLQKNEVNRAPREYLVRLGRIVRAAEAGSGSGPKRPRGSVDEGLRKRTR